MQLIQTVTVGAGGAASIEFTGIPQDGTDLLLVVSARGATGPFEPLLIRLNNLTTGQTSRRLQGSGSAASSSSFTGLYAPQHFANGSSTTANTFGNTQIYIPNYSTVAAKSYSFDAVTENNGTEAFQQLVAVASSDTAAVTSLVIATDGSTISQHSTASLYKITKA